MIQLSPQDEHLRPLLTVQANGYVRLRGFGALHRHLANPPPDLCVDHINGDPLDNRRENLRVCTHQQNMWNRKTHAHSSTGVKNVAYERGRGYRAYITHNGKRRWLGRRSTAAAAHELYVEEARRLFGEFART